MEGCKNFPVRGFVGAEMILGLKRDAGFKDFRMSRILELKDFRVKGF